MHRRQPLAGLTGGVGPDGRQLEVEIGLGGRRPCFVDGRRRERLGGHELGTLQIHLGLAHGSGMVVDRSRQVGERLGVECGRPGRSHVREPMAGCLGLGPVEGGQHGLVGRRFHLRRARHGGRRELSVGLKAFGPLGEVGESGPGPDDPRAIGRQEPF